MSATKITVTCPHCNHAGRVPESHAGREVGCPECGRRFAAIATRSPLPAFDASDSDPRVVGGSTRQSVEDVLWLLVAFAFCFAIERLTRK